MTTLIIPVVAGEVNAVTPDEQINECLARVLQTAFSQIEEYGWHVPIGFTQSAGGGFSYILSDEADRGDDEAYDIPKATWAIRDRLAKMVAANKIVVAGIATNELTRFSDTGDKQTTVKITICHCDIPGVTIFYPYRLEDGHIEQDPPLEMDADEDFLAGSG